MRLVAEVTEAEFAAVESRTLHGLCGPVEVIEIRQGLLCLERRPLLISFVSRTAAPKGTAQSGPLIRAWWAQED